MLYYYLQVYCLYFNLLLLNSYFMLIAINLQQFVELDHYFNE